MELLIILILGLCFGSFANVCIYRLPEQLSLMKPSNCPDCNTPIHFSLNIPIVSYLLLNGRSTCCKKPISLVYPIVEILIALIFVYVYIYADNLENFVLISFFLFSLVVLFFTDLKTFILPNLITYSLSFIGLAISITEINPFGISGLESLTGGIIAAFILFTISKTYFMLRKREGMGMGDIKMFGMIGFWLGIEPVIIIIILSSFSGALIGILLIALNRIKKDQFIPYGSFISLATVSLVMIELYQDINLIEQLSF